MKKLAITIIALLCLCSSVQAAGLTVWGLTEQMTTVEDDNSLQGRVGYFLGTDAGGLEPFIGSVWRPRLEDTPQVIILGAVQHMADVIDPNSPIPYIPELFLQVLSEDISARPYIGGQFSINFIDRDSGFYGALAGVALKLDPAAKSELIFELSYDNTFGDLAGVSDSEFKGYMGFRIPF